MSFQFDELPDSRSGDDDSQVRKYYANGSSDDVYVQAFARSTVPSVVVTATGNLYRQPLQYDWESSNHCVVTANYARLKNETGSFSWNFDTTGGTVNIKASKSTIASYPGGAAQHDGAIGVNGEEVEGTEIIIPALKFNVSFRHPTGAINIAKAFQLGDATGSSNNDTFFTKPAGSFLFLGATGGDGTESEATLDYQFAYSKNLQNAVIGGITVTEKDGWDYAWIEFKSDADAGRPIRTPLAIHVERVYDRISYGSTFGFT
jgi:hypothetical protein